MNPARKRRIRLVVALSAALLLASALIYTSFSASSEAVTPSRLATSAATGRARRNLDATELHTRGSHRSVKPS